MEPEFIEYFSKMRLELEHADNLHGKWHGLSRRKMLAAIWSELDEVDEAAETDDVFGTHGILRELEQVGVVVYKMHREVLRAEKEKQNG